MTRAPFTTSLLCALALVGCAAEGLGTVEICRFGEVVGTWRVEPPMRREMVFVIDTHGDIPSRAEVASAVATIVRVVVTGDVEGDGIPETSFLDDDLRIAVISSALACGESPASMEWAPTLRVGGDVESFVMRVEKAVTELPACTSSTPLAATAHFLASQELDDVGPVVIDVVIITDEDEPGANAASLVGLRLPDPYRLEMVGVVSPTPAGLDPTNPDWDALLASLVCVDGVDGARELLSAARALDEARAVSVAIGSLCDERWIGVLDAITHRLVGVSWCVAGPAVSASELADCELIERLDRAGLHALCADLPGRDPVPLAIDDEGFETCRIIQRSVDDTAPGWRLVPTHDFRCTEAEVELEWVGIETEPAAIVELRCGSIPAIEDCE